MFLRAEFERFGRPAQVGSALSQLTQGGALVRLGLDVYAEAKPSMITGKLRITRKLSFNGKAVQYERV